MENNYYIENNESVENQVAPQKIIKKFEPHMAILEMQCIICIVVVAFCLIVKLFFGNFFSELKDWYSKNINVDTNISQVLKDNSQNKASGGPIDDTDVNQTAAIKTSDYNDFTYPVSAGTVSSNYGYRNDPFTRQIAMHNGIDIAAESGSKIKAVLDGRVITAETNHSDYGNYILLDHNGIKTLYAHCKELKVDVGQIVSKGQTIALCGSTGRSTGSHLHFEVRVGNTRIDPTPFLLAAKND